MKKTRIVVVGAGIGGLASTLQLAHQGYTVDVFEAHDMPGGKMRTVSSPIGPIDAGPTVFTLKHVFERLIKSKQRRELFGTNAKRIMATKKNIP